MRAFEPISCRHMYQALRSAILKPAPLAKLSSALVSFSLLALCASEGAALPNITPPATHVEVQTIQTARHANLKIQISFPQSVTNQDRAGVVILAGGQSCESSSDLFETLRNETLAAGFNFVQFNWGYCALGESAAPSAFLLDEIDDLSSVFQFVKSDARFRSDQISLLGKSLGSIVAYRVFARIPEARGLGLLTPVCSVQNPSARLGRFAGSDVGVRNYPDLDSQTRPIWIGTGRNDKACLIPELYQLISHTQGNVSTMVVAGDHSFRVMTPSGELDPEKTRLNRSSVVQGFTSWMRVLP